eukprot:TRINITY_DN3768_c0_g1_i3.p1 TRINITY_DN3768_c0_g1~~TRINITY_DN3768_c0_g1_i3.p1  ORF type:complete len:377 (-),score=33.29 TRINITY_DN3768_c0_g1_i3:68-1198(-)
MCLRLLPTPSRYSRQLYSCLAVNHAWRRVAQTDELWAPLFEKWRLANNERCIGFRPLPPDGEVRVDRTYEMGLHDLFVALGKCKSVYNDYVAFEITLLGNLGVGKTSLLSRFVTGEAATEVPKVFRNATVTTFYNNSADECREVRISLFDTEMWDYGACDPDAVNEPLERHRMWDVAAAQSEDLSFNQGESYYVMRAITLPNTDCFLICFDITDKKSFENVTVKWVQEIKRFMTITPFIIVLCGTKLDQADKRVVSREEGIAVAKGIAAYAYIECSSGTGQNVDRTIACCLDGAFRHLPHHKHQTEVGSGSGQPILHSFGSMSKRSYAAAGVSGSRKNTPHVSPARVSEVRARYREDLDRTLATLGQPIKNPKIYS